MCHYKHDFSNIYTNSLKVAALFHKVQKVLRNPSPMQTWTCPCDIKIKHNLNHLFFSFFFFSTWPSNLVTSFYLIWIKRSFVLLLMLLWSKIGKTKKRCILCVIWCFEIINKLTAKFAMCIVSQHSYNIMYNCFVSF